MVSRGWRLEAEAMAPCTFRALKRFRVLSYECISICLSLYIYIHTYISLFLLSLSLSLSVSSPGAIPRAIMLGICWSIWTSSLVLLSLSQSSAGVLWLIGSSLSAAFCAAYGFTGAFGRNLCKFTFPQRRRNLRKSLLLTTRPTGVKRAKKWLR